MINYKPFEERTPDSQYHDLLQEIKDDGRNKGVIHDKLSENEGIVEKGAREITGGRLQFKMENGFPLLNERNLRKPFRGAIGELVAFLNGAQTLEGLEGFGCPRRWWENWVTEEKCAGLGLPTGNLGDGSYGASLARFHAPDGGEFNQVQAVMEQMKNLPFLRTHVMTTWNPVRSMGDEAQGYKRQVSVAPCHGNFVHFVLFEEDKVLEMTHTQRSADVPVGLQFNIIEWAALGMMAAHILGYEFTKYTHFLSEPHYYMNQKKEVDELLSREPRRFPTVTLEPGREVTRLEDFRPEDFEIGDDYDPHPWLSIPTPI